MERHRTLIGAVDAAVRLYDKKDPIDPHELGRVTSKLDSLPSQYRNDREHHPDTLNQDRIFDVSMDLKTVNYVLLGRQAIRDKNEELAEEYFNEARENSKDRGSVEIADEYFDEAEEHSEDIIRPISELYRDALKGLRRFISKPISVYEGRTMGKGELDSWGDLKKSEAA